MSDVKLYTRRDLVRMATIGIAGTAIAPALEGAGISPRARSLITARDLTLGGKSKPWWEDQDLTVLRIVLDSSDTTFSSAASWTDDVKVWWDASRRPDEYQTISRGGSFAHDYGTPGEYIVAVSSNSSVLQSRFTNNNKIFGLLAIGSKVTNIYSTFSGCTNLSGDIPNLRNVTSCYSAFARTKVSPKIVQISLNATHASSMFSLANSIVDLELIGCRQAPFDITNNDGIRSFTARDLTTFAGAQTGASKLERAIMPNVTRLTGNTFYSCTKLARVEVGLLVSIGSALALNLAGSSLQQGTEFICNNTMDSLRALANFPWNAPTKTRFVCSDGTITYDSVSKSWINNPK